MLAFESLAGTLTLCCQNCLVALQCMHYLTEAVEGQMKTHLLTFMPALIEKLGDSKEQAWYLSLADVVDARSFSSCSFFLLIYTDAMNPFIFSFFFILVSHFTS